MTADIARHHATNGEPPMTTADNWPENLLAETPKRRAELRSQDRDRYDHQLELEERARISAQINKGLAAERERAEAEAQLPWWRRITLVMSRW
jgi:hypothetical protein